MTQACRGAAVSAEKAALIAKTLGEQVENLFILTKVRRPLSNKTVLEHHRFIHTVLDQAEREMLVPYNAAAKASPPSVERKPPEYFQPEERRHRERTASIARPSFLTLCAKCAPGGDFLILIYPES